LGGAQGQASDIVIQAKEIVRSRERLNQILSETTGQPIEVIERDTDRDFYMDAQGAVNYGLVDSILTPVPTLPGNGHHHLSNGHNGKALTG
jgi:ATP-dependent Clp protease, protease subunit